MNEVFVPKANLKGQKIQELFTALNLGKPNLSSFDLSGANLSQAVLSDLSLVGTVLYGADLSGASLIGADLSGANLTEASLNFVDLSGVNLINATLNNTGLFGADLKNVILDMNVGNLGTIKGTPKSMPVEQTIETAIKVKYELVNNNLIQHREGTIDNLTNSVPNNYNGNATIEDESLDNIQKFNNLYNKFTSTSVINASTVKNITGPANLIKDLFAKKKLHNNSTDLKFIFILIC